MNRFTLLLLAAFCVLCASATDYVGTTVVETSLTAMPSEGTVLSIVKNANGQYDASLVISFNFRGYELSVDDVTFENMSGTTGSDGYTTITCTKQISMLDVSGLGNMIPQWLLPYLGSALDRPIVMNFNARFNGVYAAATVDFNLNLGINIPMLGIDYDIINTPVLVSFEGQSQGEEPPVTLKGDVDGNGTVDIDDMNILINILLSFDSADNYDGRADITADDQVDINDVNMLVNILLEQ